MRQKTAFLEFGLFYRAGNLFYRHGRPKKFLGLDDWKIDIIGTDISSVAISKAQRGLYSNFEVQMGLNVRTILDCFHKDGEQWMVNDDIRKMVEFRRYNLLDDIALTDKFEVIFCRNVLRFFTPEYQRQIWLV